MSLKSSTEQQQYHKFGDVLYFEMLHQIIIVVVSQPACKGIKTTDCTIKNISLEAQTRNRENLVSPIVLSGYRNTWCARRLQKSSVSTLLWWKEQLKKIM